MGSRYRFAISLRLQVIELLLAPSLRCCNLFRLLLPVREAAIGKAFVVLLQSSPGPDCSVVFALQSWPLVTGRPGTYGYNLWQIARVEEWAALPYNFFAVHSACRVDCFSVVRGQRSSETDAENALHLQFFSYLLPVADRCRQHSYRADVLRCNPFPSTPRWQSRLPRSGRLSCGMMISVDKVFLQFFCCWQSAVPVHVGAISTLLQSFPSSTRR